MLLLARWPNTTPQLPHVVLGGLAGMFTMVVLIGVLAGWMAMEFSISGGGDTAGLGFVRWTPEVLDRGAQMLLWLGFTIGVWAGLCWPERLWLPGNFSTSPQTTGRRKSATALVVYCLFGVAIYCITSLGLVTLLYE